ncbi:hypothetical protein [Roseisolibacter sp. H3M3-2]|uniref:hypothetical protein n=1 Tax=Roseisolibacter sp. H3M3-2 TaxID=3031323 RepID=UPI0023D99F05|nr:hypothetical protein [Roseisolibacter sp. H3M3-2]MDF1501730.1 hypothetical protein [Roseisolibacter sp. H3M3-2]
MIAFDGNAPAPDRARTARALEGLTAAAGLVPQPAGALPALDDDDFLATDESLELEPAEAPLRRYLRYQVQDFVKQRAVWLLALGLMGIYFFWDNYDPAQMAERMRSAPGGGTERVPEAESFRGITLALSSAFALLATVFSVHGVVSQERERGLQRFLFAKPVARVPYYLQKLGVAFAGTLALTLVVVLLGGLVFGRAVPVEQALMLATALFASVGGLAFLLSTLVRFEGGMALIATLAVIPLREFSQETDIPYLRWLGELRVLLPPVEHLGPLVDPSINGDPLRAMLYAFGYGALCVAAGIAVLRRRSILT